MLTGHVPFTANTPLGVYLKHVGTRPIEPATLNPTIPASINDIILRVLQKEPRHRYTTVHDFAQAYKEAYDVIKNPPPMRKKQLKLIGVPLNKAITQEIQLRQKRRASHITPLLLAAAIILCIIPLTLGFIISSHTNSIQHSSIQTLLLSGEQTKPSSTPTVQSTPSTNNNTTHTKVQPTPSSYINQQSDNNNSNDDDNNSKGNKRGKGHAYGHNK